MFTYKVGLQKSACIRNKRFLPLQPDLVFSLLGIACNRKLATTCIETVTQHHSGKRDDACEFTPEDSRFSHEERGRCSEQNGDASPNETHGS